MALDFPLWLRGAHVLNILFISLLARSGLEILSAHPKLYWNDACLPGSEWLKLSAQERPRDELWTSREEETSYPSLIALPGHKNLGLGRHWHLACVGAWLLVGLVYVVLLFASDEWRRLVPTSWGIFPQAWHDLVTYLSFELVQPPDGRYDALQQLSYFAVVFLLAPFMLFTGAAMSPAIAGRFPWYLKPFGGRQGARSLHFLSLLAFVAFTVVHTLMVILHGLPDEASRIVLGRRQGRGADAIIIGAVGLALILVIHVLATVGSLRRPDATKHALGLIVYPLQWRLAHAFTSRQRYPRRDVSAFARVNGRPPRNPEYERLADGDFAGWSLALTGLVEQPQHLSLADLRAMPRETQVTMHDCIQGWSYLAAWTGVPLADVIARCRPLPAARYAVFHAYDDKAHSEPHPKGGGFYYDTLALDLAAQPQAILAYDMNGAPLPIRHGAPLRLRVETQLGFKMVKYLRAIEFVETYTSIGEGHGGWREDHEQYSRVAAI